MQKPTTKQIMPQKEPTPTTPTWEKWAGSDRPEDLLAKLDAVREKVTGGKRMIGDSTDIVREARLARVEEKGMGMKTDLIQSFYAYNTWANERILTTAAKLTNAQFIAAGSASFSSVRDTLVHTMWGQWNWLSRWRGGPNYPFFDPTEYPNVAAVRARWAEIDRETHAFVAQVDETALKAICHYVNSRDEPMAYPLWQQMLHQVNHGTQHRSEVAVILTEYGHSPGWMDFIVYLDTLKGD